jgi:lipoprotein-anchoring transpeptidase ErfK/SrfK
MAIIAVKLWGSVLLVLGLSLGPCLGRSHSSAAPPDLKPDSINSAEWSKKLPADAVTPLAIRLQVLLDRAHFSPGEIDGKFGENAKKALRAFAESQQLPFTGTLTEELWQRLSVDQKPVLTQYTIGGKDVAGPFLSKLPAKMEDMKNIKRLSYTSARQELAEKFHMSQELLSALNPGQPLDREGVAITVADVAVATNEGARVEKLEVDKDKQTVKAFDRAGRLVAFYPATVGSEEKPSPTGTLKVTSIDHNPTYGYNPDYKFKGVHSKTAFEISPGPNNPVGTIWIGLSAEGYGIHGTAYPGRVSKAESHGCVRLTNWDAESLAKQVHKGTPVVFVSDKSPA